MTPPDILAAPTALRRFWSQLSTRDFAALDSLHARPFGDTLTSWPGTPTVLVNDNLLAILLSDNAEQVERVSLALTAGPPPKATSAVPESP